MQKLIDWNTEIEAQAVRAQVARILASEGFARSPRMQRFLDFVVEETLAGRAAHLREYAIAVSVFDRGEDFEPALDPIVRNDARFGHPVLTTGDSRSLAWMPMLTKKRCM